jgi:hypothetical protein
LCGRCWVRTNEGLADGLQTSLLCPSHRPLTSAYALRGTAPGCLHPRLQAHGELIRATDRNAPGHGRRSRNGYADRPPLPWPQAQARGFHRVGPCRGSAGQPRQGRYTARVATVISSPDLGVFAVAAAGGLCAFPCAVDALPEQCLRRRPVQVPLSLLLLELIGHYVNAVQVHVNAADVLVRRGVDAAASDNRLIGARLADGRCSSVGAYRMSRSGAGTAASPG